MLLERIVFVKSFYFSHFPRLFLFHIFFTLNLNFHFEYWIIFILTSQWIFAYFHIKFLHICIIVLFSWKFDKLFMSPLISRHINFSTHNKNFKLGWSINVASRHIIMASLICFDIDCSVAVKDSNNISSERACWNYYWTRIVSSGLTKPIVLQYIQLCCLSECFSRQ